MDIIVLMMLQALTVMMKAWLMKRVGDKDNEKRKLNHGGGEGGGTVIMILVMVPHL